MQMVLHHNADTAQMAVPNVVSRTRHMESNKGGDPSKVDKDGAPTPDMAWYADAQVMWLGMQSNDGGASVQMVLCHTVCCMIKL